MIPLMIEKFLKTYLTILMLPWMIMLRQPKKTAPKPYQLQPVVEKSVLVSAPKLVAMSMGWMTREKSMSEAARATMRMWVERIFCGLNIMTVTTSRLEKKLTITGTRIILNNN